MKNNIATGEKLHDGYLCCSVCLCPYANNRCKNQTEYERCVSEGVSLFRDFLPHLNRLRLRARPAAVRRAKGRDLRFF